MKLLLIMGALVPQDSAPPTPPAGPAPEVAEEVAEEEEPQVEPWDGTFAAGMAEVVRLAASEEEAAALALTDRLLAPSGYQRWCADLEESGGLAGRLVASIDGPLTWLGLERLPGPLRAEVRLARGLLRARLEEGEQADRELELARADAGPGALREAAIYALGTLDLGRGEVLRQSIPEVSGAEPAPPGASEEEEPDPLELARACYRDAREHLVEGLQLDWRDADTRANVELCVRRLRELDEIEREREERERQQQEDEQQPSDEPSEGDGEEEGDEQKGEPEEPQPDEGERDQPDEPMPDEPAESDEQQVPEEVTEEEVLLTEEQMKQLLEQLRRHQEAGEQLEERLRRRGPVRGERDW